MVLLAGGGRLLVLVVCFYQTSGNIEYRNEYRMRLKKSDPFIDGFVPTEYTTGFSKYQKVYD